MTNAQNTPPALKDLPPISDKEQEKSAASTPPTLAQRAVRGSLWVALGSYSNIAFGFLANLALTRILTPEHFGAFSYASFIVSLLNLRTRIPISYGFMQKKETTAELIGTNLALNYLFSTAGLCLVGLAAPILHLLGKPWEVAWLAMAMASIGLIDSYSSLAAVLLDRDLRFGWTSMISSVAFPVSYLPAIWLGLHGYGPWSLLAQNFTYIVLSFPGVVWISRRQVPHLWRLRWKFDQTLAKQLLKVGLTISVGSVASLLVGTFDNFLIGTFVSLEALGFYDRAYRLAQWPTLLITNVISKTAIYTYARLQDDPVRLSKTVTMTFWIITMLGLPIAVGMFIAAPDLVTWFYEERWLPSATFLRFLVIFAVIQPLMGDAGFLFIAVGKQKKSVIIALVEASVLIVFGTAFTLRWGALGTCAAVGLTFLIGLTLTHRFVREIVAINLWEVWLAPALAAGLTLAGYFLLAPWLNLPAWPILGRLVFQGFYALLGYSVLVLLLLPRNTVQKFSYVWRLMFRT